jgi:hypothetical protein
MRAEREAERTIEMVSTGAVITVRQRVFCNRAVRPPPSALCRVRRVRRAPYSVPPLPSPLSHIYSPISPLPSPLSPLPDRHSRSVFLRSNHATAKLGSCWHCDAALLRPKSVAWWCVAHPAQHRGGSRPSSSASWWQSPIQRSIVEAVAHPAQHRGGSRPSSSVF